VTAWSSGASLQKGNSCVSQAPSPSSTAVPPRGVRRALARANRLMVEERFSDAADIFERLSGQARQRGMLVRAANLTLQASRARLAAADVESALGHAREALRLFVRDASLFYCLLVLPVHL